jgi:methyl-accepting chemotaxis protein
MTLELIRQRGAAYVAALAALMTLVVVGSEWLFQGSLGVGSLLAGLGLSFLLATYLAARQSPAFRYLAVAVMMGEVVALLIAARGLPYQTDIHMTLDELVFYGGGGVGRVMLHAVILVIEAAGLVWMTLNTRKLLVIAEQRSEQAQASAHKAQMLTDEVQHASILRRDEREQTMQHLSTEFGRVVDAAVNGDFNARIETQFGDEALNKLARSINTLVGTTGDSIAETGRVLSQLACSDLTARMDGNYEGAFATLRDDINTVASRLETMMASLRASMGALRAATGEILEGANDLSERTTRQATTIEQTTAAMQSLAETVLQNAKRAHQASVNAVGVTKNAEEGGSAMAQATDAMDKIKVSSANISSIIGLIDDIAFQTNLLALNASVEAARAGDAGKGFAVVAIEVRRLAQSAAQASSDVKELIESSANEVGTGSRLVAEASEKLEAVLASAKASSELIEGIAHHSREQASAIEQITVAVRQIDEMTHHNAALVEQTNAAIEQTEGQVGEIEHVVAGFKTSGSPSGYGTDADLQQSPHRAA